MINLNLITPLYFFSLSCSLFVCVLLFFRVFVYERVFLLLLHFCLDTVNIVFPSVTFCPADQMSKWSVHCAGLVQGQKPPWEEIEFLAGWYERLQEVTLIEIWMIVLELTKTNWYFFKSQICFFKYCCCVLHYRTNDKFKHSWFLNFLNLGHFIAYCIMQVQALLSHFYCKL